ncbi:MAG: VOC family protein [Candidatus Manganitrophus sp. SB1]|nr:VOC family protein [Candidatus Manganitrophus morganii]
MSEENRPLPLRGLRHLALKVTDIGKSRRFYEGILGMRIVWEPDPENLYLSFGSDNLALHQIPPGETPPAEMGQRLDHFGFIAENESIVDAMVEKMETAGVPIVKPVKRHRDGSYSFYMADPDGNVIQVLYEPHISPLP